MYTITVVGAGYVGLVTVACRADFDDKVICVDNDPSKVERPRNGVVQFFESGLAFEPKTGNLRPVPTC